MNCFLMGATGGLGRALANELARNQHRLYLVGRDAETLGALSAELREEHGVDVDYVTADLADFDPDQLAENAVGTMGGLDAVIIASGLGDPDDNGSLDDSGVRRLLEVNMNGPVRLLNALSAHLADRPDTAVVVGIGSVASVRGRGQNMAYAGAKSGLDTYFEALRHRLDGTACRVQFYRAGFMRTSMFGDRKSILPVARPERVAEVIVRNLSRRSGTRYVPAWWVFPAIVLRWMPWAAFRRLSV